MANWILKTMLQKGLGVLPRSQWWNAQFQKYVTHGYYPKESVFQGKLVWCGKHLEAYRRFGAVEREAFTALELGTGTWPIVPIGLYLCGAKKVYTFDIESLLTPELVRCTMGLFVEAGRTGELHRLLPGVKQDRLDVVLGLADASGDREPGEVLEAMQIVYRVGDARATRLDAASVDLLFSTVCFEHIPRVVLQGLFEEFHRVVSPKGVMSHYIGLADQYAGVDPSITPFNFLRYTDRQWKWLNNPIIPLTRLRMPEYREVFVRAGFQILEEANEKGEGADLDSVPVAPEFRSYSREDLLVLFSWLIAGKERGNSRT